MGSIAVAPATDSPPEETEAGFDERLGQVLASHLNRREAVPFLPTALQPPARAGGYCGLVSLAVGLTPRPRLLPPALLVYIPVNGPLQASPAAVGEPVSHLELCLLQKCLRCMEPKRNNIHLADWSQTLRPFMARQWMVLCLAVS